MAYITGYPIFRQAILVRFPEDGHPLLTRRLHCNAKRETMSVSHSHIISRRARSGATKPNLCHCQWGLSGCLKIWKLQFPNKKAPVSAFKAG